MNLDDISLCSSNSFFGIPIWRDGWVGPPFDTDC